MPAKYALDVLRTGKIKVTTASDANDPDEIIPCLGRDEPLTPELRDMKRFWLSGERGFISLSLSGESNPMWGLYADRFRGLVLAFEHIPNEYQNAPDFFPVKYSPFRYLITQHELDVQKDQSNIEEQTRELFAHKDYQWAYENEWRRMVSIRNAQAQVLDNGETGYFVDVASHLNLVGVIIGPDSRITLGDVENAVKGREKKGFVISKLCHDGCSFGLRIIERKIWQCEDTGWKIYPSTVM